MLFFDNPIGHATKKNIELSRSFFHSPAEFSALFVDTSLRKIHLASATTTWSIFHEIDAPDGEDPRGKNVAQTAS